MNMIVDFTNNNSLVYFNGNLPQYTQYRMRLVSKFSNEALLNDTIPSIGLTLSGSGTNWYSFKYTGNLTTAMKEDEIEGYYDCILEGYTALTGWTEIQKVLCKLKNNFNKENPDVKYASDNENNEQFIYFNNE